MMQFFRPIKGCKVVATDSHHKLNAGDYVGIVHKVDGNIITFKNRQGEHENMLWRFKEGNNTTITFGA